MGRNWATDNERHRAVGEMWEQQFCQMAASFGFDCRRKYAFTGPDRTVRRGQVVEHHELKHKDPNWEGLYGFEDYRLKDLLAFRQSTGQATYLTVHDYSLAGVKRFSDETPNDLADWLTAEISELGEPADTRPGWTYRGGRRERANIHYWSCHRWQPLGHLWGQDVEDKTLARHFPGHYFKPRPVPCYTCGLPSTSTFGDGSPRYDHGHYANGEGWSAGDDGAYPRWSAARAIAIESAA